MNRKENCFLNEDCIEGCKKHIKDNSVDLIVTDPPYGINGHTLHKHYNRKEGYVLDGYIEIPQNEYPQFSEQWIKQAERILKPGGSIYIVSGYTHLIDILNALRKTKLKEINHIIWKYNFGVFTKNKFVTSHYHLLYYCKPGAKPTFNTYCRYGQNERDGGNGSLNYLDREDVWIINREYKPGKIKNKNELPTNLLTKIIQYSSRESDVVCDLFLGGFSTARIAVGLNRIAWGFELSASAYKHGMNEFSRVKKGALLQTLRKPEGGKLVNQGIRWSRKDLEEIAEKYDKLYQSSKLKRQSIDILSEELGRGYFSILNALKKMGR
ncbi:MAG: site-specific DNA-methyltransferase [Candidatus Omnitrophica bacterium]|nr:site-specific DNA-methyltransferase [Candidatus Omnitrophota bacterium]